MSMKVDVNQFDWECALHDVMDIICKYLNLKDLCSLAKVNKTWRDVALREKAKRLYVQQLRLPYNFGKLANLLNVKPYLSLLIYDSKLEKSLSLPEDKKTDLYSNGLEEELIEYFKKQLPHEVLVLRVDEYLTTGDLQLQSIQDQCELKLIGNTNILGLFFPSVKRRAQIQVASILHYLHYEPGMAADHLIEELGLNHCEHPKSTLFLFFDVRDYFAPKIVSELHKRVQNYKEITWISVFGSKLAISRCDRNPFWGSRHNIVAMRICGPSIKSWSTFIPYSSQCDEIERKLLELKDKVTKPEQCCTGLLYSTKCSEPGCNHIQHPCANRHGLMQKLECIFPSIPFLGLFEEDDLSELPPVDNQILDKIVSGQNESWFRGSLLRTFTSIIIVSYGD